MTLLTSTELAIAIASGLCGTAATILTAQRRWMAAGIVGGIGVVLCNVVWVIRILHPAAA